MKAAVIMSPGELVVKEIPDPVIGPYDVLCQTLAAAVCCGTDNHMIADHPYFNMTFPAVLGHEGIGRVIACGSDVRNFKVGDMITRIINKLPDDSEYALKYGAFAELSTATDWQAMATDGLPPERWAPLTVHRRLPEGIDPVAATMIITWRETFSFLSRMTPQKGDAILIIGSGANALAFADHGRNLELKVAVVGSPSRADVFEQAGAGRIVSYTRPDIKPALAHTLPSPFDIIIDTIGKPDALNPLAGLLKKNGKIGIYGLYSFHDYHINFSGFCGDFSCYSGEYYDEGAAHDDIMTALEAGRLDPWHYLSKNHIYPLACINDALHACTARKTMKSVITFD